MNFRYVYFGRTANPLEWLQVMDQILFRLKFPSLLWGSVKHMTPKFTFTNTVRFLIIVQFVKHFILVNFLNLRIQILAQCEGFECRKMHIPYVDIGISRSKKELTAVRSTLSLEPPSAAMAPVSDCVPQSDGNCNVFNCPWVHYHINAKNVVRQPKKKCIHLTAARRDVTHDASMTVAPVFVGDKPDKIIELSFNFAHGSSINNMKFQYPAVPFYHDKKQWGVQPCPSTESVPEEGTQCTQVMT